MASPEQVERLMQEMAEVARALTVAAQMMPKPAELVREKTDEKEKGLGEKIQKKLKKYKASSKDLENFVNVQKQDIEALQKDMQQKSDCQVEMAVNEQLSHIEDELLRIKSNYDAQLNQIAVENMNIVSQLKQKDEEIQELKK